MENLKIAIGSDHAGFQLKERIVQYLKEKDIEVKDFGTYDENSCDYPDYAKAVAKNVASGAFNKGILVCGSGIGVSITANKVRGIRAALCWNISTAASSRSHNDSNILCLAQRQTEEKLALEMVDVWLNTKFEGGRHQARVDKIEE